MPETSALEFVKDKLKSREALYLIVDDPRAKKVLVGWMKYYPSCQDFFLAKTNQDPHLVLERLWQTVGAIDWVKLAECSGGGPASRIQRIFDRLKAVHLVWPDGTIHQEALVLIQTEVGIALSGVVKQARRSSRP